MKIHFQAYQQTTGKFVLNFALHYKPDELLLPVLTILSSISFSCLTKSNWRKIVQFIHVEGGEFLKKLSLISATFFIQKPRT